MVMEKEADIPLDEDCSVCNNLRTIFTAKGFKNCACLKRWELHCWLKTEFFLTEGMGETPLKQAVQEKRSLLIEYDNIQILRVHISRALTEEHIRKKHLCPTALTSWRFVALPDDIMKDDHNWVYDVELLVLNYPGTFPYYRKASQRHHNVIQSRRTMGKPTWIAIKGTVGRIVDSTGAAEMIPEFKADLLGLERIQITTNTTRPLMRQSPVAGKKVKPPVTRQPVSQEAADVKLLFLNPELDEVINQLRGTP